MIADLAAGDKHRPASQAVAPQGGAGVGRARGAWRSGKSSRNFSARGSSIGQTREVGLSESGELELIARLRRRDLDALGELYRMLGGSMLTLARSMMGDRDEADDVVEDALVRIHEAAPGFRGERGLRTWTLRIVANLCRDRLRRRRFSAGPPEALDPLANAGLRLDPVPDWDAAIDQRRLLGALERALLELPDEQREAVILRDRMGLSYEDVAATLGISLGAVKSRLFRGRESLKRAMASYLDG